ncbi:MAG: hypothetical protein GY862_00765 [Gammaproteobacteria bacterium]|nr:hypothetical protein [Gammaproteobacteria bacterium]
MTNIKKTVSTDAVRVTPAAGRIQAGPASRPRFPAHCAGAAGFCLDGRARTEPAAPHVTQGPHLL